SMGVLPNGIHYYIQENARPEQRAEIRLAVNAGSILEDEDQLGLAHFVEHMAFNGTENFEKNELVDYLETTGTRFGPDLNAFTSFDETVYMLQVRTDSTELFDKGMQVIRDWANGITFADEEIDKERGVIVSEWRTRLSPDQRMQQKTFPVMYQGSRYAERLPIGKMDIVENAPYDVLRRFYKEWYRPDLMAVVAVGDFDAAMVEKKIKALFGDIPEAADARPREKFEVPFHDETLVSIASDKEASFTNVNIMYKHDRVETKTVGDYRSSLVRSLYNSMLGARLQEISKQPDPPFVFAYTGYSADVGDLDSYSSFAFVPEGKGPAALKTLLTENKRVLQHGFTTSEMDRAKKNLIEGAERAFKEMDKTESNRIVMNYVYRYLDDAVTPGPKQKLDLYNQFLPSV
ncbi:MAG: pitrilysin family protein, partial [Bacteroidota bacterium]